MNNIDEFEDQEQSKFDAVDLRRHREQFRGQREKANVEASAERVPSTGVWRFSAWSCIHGIGPNQVEGMIAEDLLFASGVPLETAIYNT